MFFIELWVSVSFGIQIIHSHCFSSLPIPGFIDEIAEGVDGIEDDEYWSFI